MIREERLLKVLSALKTRHVTFKSQYFYRDEKSNTLSSQMNSPPIVYATKASTIIEISKAAVQNCLKSKLKVLTLC